MTHPPGEAQNLTTQRLQMTQKLMTHPSLLRPPPLPNTYIDQPLMHLSSGQEKGLTFVLYEDSSELTDSLRPVALLR